MKYRQAPSSAYLPHTTMAPYGIQYQRPRRSAAGRFFRFMFGLIALVILVVAGYLSVGLYQSASELTGEKNPLTLLSGLWPATLKQTNGRTNILLAGYSADDAGHGGAELTDSIMILSVDPATKDAAIISIPRDLYVNIPGYGYSKINAAYEYGEHGRFTADGYPSGGMGLLEQTISQNFGVQFHYYALLNYAAFRSAVDAVGGVTVNIQSTDPDGLYDPNANLKLPNGLVNLNGQQALDLARARGAGYGSYGFGRGDFNRTANQQMILIALKNKVGNGSVIANPLKVVQLSSAVGENVKTDMTLGEMQTLYSKSKDLSDSSIKSVTLNDYNGTNLLRSYATQSGQSALIPAAGIDDYSAIQSAMRSLMVAAPPSN